MPLMHTYKEESVYPVIMAGGVGSRFWPRSRNALPKQFLPLLGDKSLLTCTGERCEALAPKKNTLVLTDKAYKDWVLKALPWVIYEQIILEPVNRDTAPCIALAAALIKKKDPEALLVILPSDHYIGNEAKFTADIKKALEYAQSHDEIVTIGVPPTFPCTGYGYLQKGAQLGKKLYRCNAFLEKPSLKRAEELLLSGNYLWNSGILVASAKTMWQAVVNYLPQVAQGVLAWLEEPTEEALAEIYPTLVKISIDYGVMEKTKNTVVIAASFPWDDVGSWSSIAKYWDRDKAANALSANNSHWLAMDTAGCILDCEIAMVATLGVADLLIVQCGDVLLVADKNRDQEVKNLVQELQSRGELKEFL